MNIGLLGYGTVGQALHRLLNTSNSAHHVIAILRRSGKSGPQMTSQVDDIVLNPKIDCVVELMGGIEPAYTYIQAALKQGKHVITANKALLNLHGDALNQLAYEHHVSLRFSAACGGGIPILPTLLTLRDQTLLKLKGILNGTTNYILDQMETLEIEYALALQQAQALGYAEKDPSHDVQGIDSYHKMRLALAVSQGLWMEDKSVFLEGIQDVLASDVRFLQSKKLNLRLIASACKFEDAWSMKVEPMGVKQDSLEASIRLNNNCIQIMTEQATHVLQGQGAGGPPTALNVLRDLEALDQGSMFQPQMSLVKAASDVLKQVYWVRTDQKDDWLSRHACEIVWFENHVYTKTCLMPVHRMHEEVNRIRQEQACFFAGIED